MQCWWCWSLGKTRDTTWTLTNSTAQWESGRTKVDFLKMKVEMRQSEVFRFFTEIFAEMLILVSIQLPHCLKQASWTSWG